MARCPHNCNCPHGNGSYKTQVQSLIKIYYCSNNYQNCARYILKNCISSFPVPIDLLPHERNRITVLLDQSSLSQVHG